MTSSLKLSILTGERGEPSGFDSAIIGLHDEVYAALPGGGRVFLAAGLAAVLREVSGQLAAGLGERLHHAEWVITSDPEQVRALGLMHDCASCRAGVDQALALLRERPDAELAVGRLWWA